MTTCPVCKDKNSKPSKEIKKDRFINKKIQYYKCKVCGLEFIKPQPLKELNKLYKKDYRKSVSLLQKIKWIIPYSKHHKIPLNEIKKNTKKKGLVLDIGSAEGKFLYLMKLKGWKVSGIELTKHYAEFSKKYLKIPTFSGKLENYKTKNKFDLITMLNLFEHIDEPKKILNNIYSLLKSDGQLYIVVPTPKKGEHVYGAPHLFLYSQKNIKKLLEQNKFEIKNSKIIKGSIHLWAKKKK